jgi:hypothetical protein
LLSELQLSSKAHGPRKGLRGVDFHIEAQWWLEFGSEELNVLSLRKSSCARQECRQVALEVNHRACALAGNQFPSGLKHRGGLKRRFNSSVKRRQQGLPSCCT